MRRQGFSLTELLTVTAIIAITIGVLLPVLARSRFAALEASETGMLRNLTIAQSLYTEEHGNLALGTHPLLLSGYIDEAMCSSPTDWTILGVANAFSAELAQDVPAQGHLVRPYRSSFVGYYDHGYSLVQWKKWTDEQPGVGWLVSMARARPEEGSWRAAHGHYRRLFVDGSIHLRPIVWMDTGVGKGWGPPLMYADYSPEWTLEFLSGKH